MQTLFPYDPIPALVNNPSSALVYFLQRDILHQPVNPLESLWESPQAIKILHKQRGDGSWKYPGNKHRERSPENYDQLETYRQLGLLVEKFGLNRSHPAIPKTAEFLFSFQTPTGDFRGIYGNQLTPNYSAGIMELLIKAGYAHDKRIQKGFAWLLKTRQQDGGWAIPLLTRGQLLSWEMMSAETLETDPQQPASHTITGVVLRAFAAHPEVQQTQAVINAATWLSGRLFLKDHYRGRDKAEFWLKFSYPFWFTDLLSVLDSLSQLGFEAHQPQIKKALTWFRDQQQPDGTWALNYLRSGGDKQTPSWVSLAILRVFSRFYQN